MQTAASCCWWRAIVMGHSSTTSSTVWPGSGLAPAPRETLHNAQGCSRQACGPREGPPLLPPSPPWMPSSFPAAEHVSRGLSGARGLIMVGGSRAQTSCIPPHPTPPPRVQDIHSASTLLPFLAGACFGALAASTWRVHNVPALLPAQSIYSPKGRHISRHSNFALHAATPHNAGRATRRPPHSSQEHPMQGLQRSSNTRTKGPLSISNSSTSRGPGARMRPKAGQ